MPDESSGYGSALDQLEKPGQLGGIAEKDADDWLKDHAPSGDGPFAERLANLEAPQRPHVLLQQEQTRAAQEYENRSLPEQAGEFAVRRMLPFASAQFGFTEKLDYKKALDRLGTGQASDFDVKQIATYQQVQKHEAEKSTAASALSAIGHIPAIIGEGMAAGGVIRGGAGATLGLLERGGAAAAVTAGEAAAGITLRGTAAAAPAWIGRTAAQTVLMPSMYLPQSADNAIKNGGEWSDLKNMGPAYAIGTAQVGLLGGLSQGPAALAKGMPGSLVGRALSGNTLGAWAARLMAGTGTGMTGQEAIDAGAHLAGWKSEWGTMAELAQGKEGSLKHAAVQASVFAVFSMLHAHHDPLGPGRAESANDIMRAATEYMNAAKSQGLSEGWAGLEMQTIHKQVMGEIQGKPPTEVSLTEGSGLMAKMAERYTFALRESLNVPRLAAEQRTAEEKMAALKGETAQPTSQPGQNVQVEPTPATETPQTLPTAPKSTAPESPTAPENAPQTKPGESDATKLTPEESAALAKSAKRLGFAGPEGLPPKMRTAMENEIIASRKAAGPTGDVEGLEKGEADHLRKLGLNEDAIARVAAERTGKPAQAPQVPRGTEAEPAKVESVFHIPQYKEPGRSADVALEILARKGSGPRPLEVWDAGQGKGGREGFESNFQKGHVGFEFDTASSRGTLERGKEGYPQGRLSDAEPLRYNPGLKAIHYKGSEADPAFARLKAMVEEINADRADGKLMQEYGHKEALDPVELKATEGARQQAPKTVEPAPEPPKAPEPSPVRPHMNDVPQHIQDVIDAADLTPRERAVLEGRAQGNSHQDLEAEFGVKRQRLAQIEQEAMAKLGVEHKTMAEWLKAGAGEVKGVQSFDPEVLERIAKEVTPDVDDADLEARLREEFPESFKEGMDPDEFIRTITNSPEVKDAAAQFARSRGNDPEAVRREVESALQESLARLGPRDAAAATEGAAAEGPAQPPETAPAARGAAPRRVLTQTERMAAIKGNIKPILAEAKENLGENGDIAVHDLASQFRAEDKAMHGERGRAWDILDAEVSAKNPRWRTTVLKKGLDQDSLTGFHEAVEAARDETGHFSDLDDEAAWEFLKNPRPGLSEPQAYRLALDSLLNEKAVADEAAEQVRRGINPAAVDEALRAGEEAGRTEPATDGRGAAAPSAAEVPEPGQAAGDAADDGAERPGNDEFDFGFNADPNRPRAMGAAALGELTPGEGKVYRGETALANDRIDAERVEEGLNPIIRSARMENADAWDQAMRRLQADPKAAENLIEEVVRKPRPLDVVEQAMLLREKIRLDNQYRKLQQDVIDASAKDRPALEARLDALGDQRYELALAVKRAGTELGRSLQFRRQLADEDYSLAGMLRNKEVAKGKPLTTAEQAEIAILSRRIAELEAELAKRPDEKVESVLGRLKNQFTSELLQNRWARKPLNEKLMDLYGALRRAFVLSSPVVVAKLNSAAATRMATSLPEEAVGYGVGKAFGRFGERTMMEHASAAGMAKQWATMFTRAPWADAAEVFKTGRSSLDVKYGEAQMPSRPILEFFGRLHGALKAPIKRAYYEAGLVKGAEYFIRQGEDPSNHSAEIGLAAYKSANRAIFMQDNFISDAFNKFVSRMEAPDPTTGKVNPWGKAGATLTRHFLPVVKVPTNIVGETLVHLTGLGTGTVGLSRAYLKGIETLPPEQADTIMRHLKKGSLGGAMLALGFFLPNNFGGYHQPGEKRKEDDAEVGGAKIAGVTIPRYWLHNPLLEVGQVGATIRRVADAAKGDEGWGLFRAAMGLIEEAPMAREAVDLSRLYGPQGDVRREAASQVKSAVVPAGVQWLGRNLDRPRDGTTIYPQTHRKVGGRGEDTATTVKEEVQSGVPLWRQGLRPK